MGYKVKFDSGQEIEFDTEPTEADINEAHSHLTKSTLTDQLKNLGSKAVGAGEAAMSVGSGALAIPLATVPAGLKALNDMGQGKAPHFLNDYEEFVNKMQYQPQTEAGQDISRPIGEVINRYAVPLAPMMAHIPVNMVPAIDTVKASIKRPTPVPKGLDVENVLGQAVTEKKAPEQVAQPTVDEGIRQKLEQTNDQASFWQDLGQAHDQSIQDRLKNIAQERGGDEPIYVDPQGQAFRGNPAEEQAHLALENEGQAFDNAATHDQWGKQGEPLPLLQQDRMANEGPQAKPQDVMGNALRDVELEKHPAVEALLQRVQKQEELITKLQMNEKVSPVRLAREVKNLEGLERAVENRKQQVEGRTPFSGPGKGQVGAINTDVLHKDFFRVKKLPDGTLLKAYGMRGQEFQIDAVRDGNVVSAVTFDPRDVPEHNTTNLEPFSVATHVDERGKGYATEMYKYAQELGNDIMPSFAQTTDGKKMWESFERKGMVQDGVLPAKKTTEQTLKDLLRADAKTHIGRLAGDEKMFNGPGGRQGGALLIDPKDEGKGKFLSEHPALKLPTIVPEKLTVEKATELAKITPDIEPNVLQKLIQQFTKGGLYEALKSDHPIIKFAYEKNIEADRLARGDIQTWVHDKLAPASRDLNKREAGEIWEAISRADFHEVPLTEEILRRNGANDKQIAYWKTHTEVMDRVFEGLNKVREKLGMDPIDKRIAYAAMRSTGNYRRLVFDHEGNIVGIIGSDYRRLLNKRIELMKDQHPEYVIGKEDYFGGVPRDKGSAAAAMMQTMEVLARDDPRIAEFMKKYDSLVTNEVYNFLNMKKHTMEKKGVFGMEGRKDWITAEQNAIEGMQAQINYAEAGLKWEHLADSTKDVFDVIKDPTVNETSPNAVKWADYYTKNALGYNPGVGHAMEQWFATAMKESGVGYGVARRQIANTRKIVNTTLLGLNPAFLFTNIIQPLKAMPGIKAYLASKGLDNLSLDGATGYAYFAQAALMEWRHYAGDAITGIEYGAYQYAKTHHVYGSDLIEHSNKASKDFGYYVDKIGGAGNNLVESATRRIMFFGLVKLLDGNGLSVKNGLYETAHNLTDMTMNNYSSLERPRVYNALGPVGQMAGNLSSYKHNELSRISEFARQIPDNGKYRPLLTELAATVFYAGILGLPGWQIGNELYKYITEKTGKPRSLTLDVINASEKLGKEAGATGEGQHVLSHGIFSLANVDMSKRLGIQFGENYLDIGFPGVSRLGQSAVSAGQFAKAPTEMNAKRAVRDAPFMPVPAQGNMDLEWFSKGGMSHNKDTLNAGVKRNDADVVAKRLGFTGIHESVERDKLFETKEVGKGYANLRQRVLEKARDELYSNNTISSSLAKDYLKYEGNSSTFVTDIQRYTKAQNIPAYEREMLQKAMSSSITNLRQAERLQEIRK